MDTEPINPFQSPNSVDPPLKRDNSWQPSWRDKIIALALTPVAAPIAFFVVYLTMSLVGVNAPGSQSVLGDLRIICEISYVWTFGLNLPIYWLMRRNRRLSEESVILMAGALLTLTLLVIFWAALTYELEKEIVIDIFTGFASISLAPVCLFALYLAYLRRRDQTRQRSAAG